MQKTEGFEVTVTCHRTEADLVTQLSEVLGRCTQHKKCITWSTQVTDLASFADTMKKIRAKLAVDLVWSCKP